MRRFYADSTRFHEGRVALGPDETRHIRSVLRLEPGSEVSVFDGEGSEFVCRIVEFERSATHLEITGSVSPASSESPLQITLAAAILKGEKFDLVVQKAVELGVYRLVPVISLRCEVHASSPGKRLARWQKIAVEATKQCGRAYLMNVDEPQTLNEFTAAAEDGTILMFAERGGQALEADGEVTTLTAIVGPEGGWADEELTEAHAAGVRIITLGGRIMRAETAAIAITAVLQHRFGDLN